MNPLLPMSTVSCWRHHHDLMRQGDTAQVPADGCRRETFIETQSETWSQAGDGRQGQEVAEFLEHLPPYPVTDTLPSLLEVGIRE